MGFGVHRNEKSIRAHVPHPASHPACTPQVVESLFIGSDKKMLTKQEKEKLKELALRQVGKKYIFGVEVKMTDADPKAFDCSELVQWLLWQIGFDVPDGSFNQFDASAEIPDKNYDTGDLGFCRRGKLKVGHVGIVIKVNELTRSRVNGLKAKDEFIVVEARNKNVGVVKTTLEEFMGRKSFVGIRRPILKKIAVHV